MPNLDSQHTENRASGRRFYHGEWNLIPIVEILNRAITHPDETDTLSELIVKCIRLQEAVAQVDLHSESGDLASRLKDQIRLSESPEVSHIRALERELNIQLQEFQSTPVIKFRPATTPEKRLVSYQLLPRRVAMLWSEDYDPMEYHPFYALLDAIADGTLTKIKPCNCGKYFYQRFSHQLFCSETCRIRDNQNSEKAREYRRTKQREYYNLNKTKNVK